MTGWEKDGKMEKRITRRETRKNKASYDCLTLENEEKRRGVGQGGREESVGDIKLWKWKDGRQR